MPRSSSKNHGQEIKLKRSNESTIISTASATTQSRDQEPTTIGEITSPDVQSSAPIVWSGGMYMVDVKELLKLQTNHPPKLSENARRLIPFIEHKALV